MRQPSQDLDRPHSRLSKRAAILTCQRARVNTRSTADDHSLAPRPFGNSHGFVIDPVPLEARKGGPVAVVEEGICFSSLPNTVRPSLRSVTRKIPARVDFEDTSLQGDARCVSQGHQECQVSASDHCTTDKSSGRGTRDLSASSDRNHVAGGHGFWRSDPSISSKSAETYSRTTSWYKASVFSTMAPSVNSFSRKILALSPSLCLSALLPSKDRTCFAKASASPTGANSPVSP